MKTMAKPDEDWLIEEIDRLTDGNEVLTVSQWAESKRYLPESTTPKPGPFRFDVAPYLREIADLLSIENPISEFDFMKGAQVCATVGLLENAIGYCIDHIKSVPVMLVTADAELAQLRVENNILPMLAHSGMAHLIRSNDEGNSRKTGKTAKKLEFEGGGFMLPIGALNAGKLRSTSVRYLLEDEVDSYPDSVGKDGDPQKLAEARTKAYEQTRKIARVSTPLVKGNSRIARGYERGDQRKYFVPCRKCKEMQVLKFQGRHEDTGEMFGLVWETDEDGSLDDTSVRYICEHCGHPHRNADKVFMLPRGEWRPTSKASWRGHRSYHLSGLYSPVGFYSWESAAREWLDCWDVDRNAPRDSALMQEFYNNVLGEPYEVRGSKVSFTAVSAHRRTAYHMGEIPNKYAAQFSGSRILFLTCQVDVHKRNLAVSVMGWTRDQRCYVIDYTRFEVLGDDEDCTEITSPVWGTLRTWLEEKSYTADDGAEYRIVLTLVDAGYANDTVTTFCSPYAAGVHPILGRERPAKNQIIKEFAEWHTQAGTVGYRILVDHYKDRIAPVLRREWVEDSGTQPPYHFNAPQDISDKQLKELTVETRREKKDERGNVTYFWHRPGNARNELWDLLGYGHAAVEILAWQICVQHFQMETVDWPRFWDFVEAEKLYYTEAKPL